MEKKKITKEFFIIFSSSFLDLQDGIQGKTIRCTHSCYIAID